MRHVTSEINEEFIDRPTEFHQNLLNIRTWTNVDDFFMSLEETSLSDLYLRNVKEQYADWEIFLAERVFLGVF